MRLRLKWFVEKYRDVYKDALTPTGKCSAR